MPSKNGTGREWLAPLAAGMSVLPRRRAGQCVQLESQPNQKMMMARITTAITMAITLRS